MESAESTSGSKGRGCAARGKSKSTTTASASSPSTGPTSQGSGTCGKLEPTISPMSISSPADSLAKTSPKGERGLESREVDPGCGLSSPESFANYDHASSSWRTSQVSLLGGWVEFLETWPRAGTTRNGRAFQRPPLVPHISENGFSYLPTPDASLGMEMDPMHDALSCIRRDRGEPRPSGAKIGSSLRWCPEFIREWLRTGGELNPEWTEVLMGFPKGWLSYVRTETPSSPKSLSGSGDGS